MTAISRWLVRALHRLSYRTGAQKAKHLELGQLGEAEACFYLQGLGYRVVATNFRVPGSRGEIDLIGWDDDVLCFIEVKTRSDDSFAPPSTAVTAAKRRHIVEVARRYLRRLPGSRRPCCRFDIVSVVPAVDGAPDVTLRKGAFTWDDDRGGKKQFGHYFDRGLPQRRR